MPDMPQSNIPGLIPTLNQRGFMSAAMDVFMTRFVDYAAQASGPVLDLGCAYGVATLPALERGACVVAADMDPGHLEILKRRAPEDLQTRLQTQVAVLPDAQFDAEAFAAILCSRTVHFLKPQQVEVSVASMARWLEPGGQLFLSADTPYAGFWKASSVKYLARKAAGDPWPGQIPDVGQYLPGGQLPSGMSPYLNPLDPDILERVAQHAGLVVLDKSFFGLTGYADPDPPHAGIVARKPS